MKAEWATVSLASGFLLASSAGAAVIRVPDDAPSVLAAVDAAVLGDSVLVGAGTWTEHDTRVVPFAGGLSTITSGAFVREGISIIGTSGPAQTVLVGSASAAISRNAITVTNGATGSVLIEGLTLTGPESALEVGEGSDVAVRNCRLVNTGLGVRITDSPVLIEDCLIQGNSGIAPNVQASGVDAISSDLRIVRTEFSENTGRPCLDVSGFPPTTSRLVIQDCSFRENRVGGGTVREASILTVERNAFIRNAFDSGGSGGIQTVECSGAVRFNVFAWDSVRVFGNCGGINLYNSSLDVAGNTFFGCHMTLPDGAAAVAVFSDLPMTFRNNLVVGCTGTPAVRNYGPVPPTVSCNVYWDNEVFNPSVWPVSATDLFVDPRLCDPAAEDFTLRATSPCAAENHPTCGQVGAFGVGCDTVGVDPTTWSRIKAAFRN